jgi:hypothetical protein
MTAGLASGMGGIAMDYVGYPGSSRFAAGSTFALHVRHHVAHMPDDISVGVIEALWDAFAADLADQRTPAAL